MLLDRFSVSERRACRAIGQPRSTQRRPAPVPGTEEEHLRARLRAAGPGPPPLRLSPHDDDPASGGLLREPQEDPASLP